MPKKIAFNLNLRLVKGHAMRYFLGIECPECRSQCSQCGTECPIEIFVLQKSDCPNFLWPVPPPILDGRC